MSLLTRKHAAYPEGLKPGDFIQPSDCFGDVFFEVVSCYGPTPEMPKYWNVTYITYDKYGSKPRTDWINGATGIRKVIPAEMALPVIMQKRMRFYASIGQYDPFYGFAPVGTPLRRKDD